MLDADGNIKETEIRNLKNQLTEVITEADNPEDVIWDESVIQSLAVGNKWQYHANYYDSDGNIESSADFIKIIDRDTVVSGIKWFIHSDSSTFAKFGKKAERNSDDGLLLIDFLAADGDNKAEIKYKKPSFVGEKFIFWTHPISGYQCYRTVSSLDSAILLEIGNFECFIYSDFIFETLGDYRKYRRMDDFVKPGLGAVKSTTYSVDEETGKEELVFEYYLEKFTLLPGDQ
jgi:hypothetical protein